MRPGRLSAATGPGRHRERDGTHMNASDGKTQVAWQPLTASGVAAFAGGTLSQLLLAQLVVALLAGSAVMWFAHRAWFPVIHKAIDRLPPEGELRAGQLNWAGDSPVCLAEGRFLALVVDLDHAGKARSPAHVHVEFGRADYRILSLLGSCGGLYPRGRSLAFNRTELGPWWGAWAPAILIMAGLLAAAVLMVIWACLATVYALPVWLVGIFADRQCSLAGSWRLAGAALMPGALLMCAAILLYGWGKLDLLGLAAAGAAHVVIGWLYLCGSPLRLARQEEAITAGRNPFA